MSTVALRHQNELSDPTPRVEVLVVTNLPQDRAELAELFEHSKWRCGTASTIREALASWRRNPVGVVICESHLPDGSWQDLQDGFAAEEHAPCVIVTSEESDCAMWAEVLESGGYFLLMKPFEPAEFYRTVSMAWRCWYNKSERTAPETQKPLARAAAFN